MPDPGCKTHGDLGIESLGKIRTSVKYNAIEAASKVSIYSGGTNLCNLEISNNSGRIPN